MACRSAAPAAGEALGRATVFCAGQRQYNAPLPAVPEVLRQIEVLGLTGPTRVVVEALDRQCPFVGLVGDAAYSTRAEDPSLTPADRVAFGIVTEATARTQYAGSLIVGGQAPGPQLAAAAPWTPPRVLARTSLQLRPTGTDVPRLAFYDDFADATDVPVRVGDGNTYSDRNSNGTVLQNSRWSFYAYNYDHLDLHLAHGALGMTLADRYQEVFASVFMTPRRTVALDDDRYLHVTYTVGSDSSQRRYPWLFLCGPKPGVDALDAQGRLRTDIVQTAFFYQDDGRNPSLANFNCLQIFSRDGLPFPLGAANARPQGDLRVMLNRPDAPKRSNVVNISPDQYNSRGRPGLPSRGWYQQQDAGGNLTGPMLDDQMLLAPRTRYDVYIHRSRAVVYINGSQRLCNDFPTLPLTMGQGILGIGQVLYHTSAERSEFVSPTNTRSGQIHYLKNTPYADVRTWDGVGYHEHVAAPSGFDASLCYVYRP